MARKKKSSAKKTATKASKERPTKKTAKKKAVAGNSRNGTSSNGAEPFGDAYAHLCAAKREAERARKILSAINPDDPRAVIHQLLADNAELKSENTDLKQQVAECEDFDDDEAEDPELVKARAEIEKLEGKLSASRDEAKKSRAEVKTLRQERDSLLAEKTSLLEKLTEAQDRLPKLEHDNGELSERVRNLESRLDEETRALSDLLGEMRTY